MENTPATADAKAPVEAPASTENAAPAAPAPAETAQANTINLTDDQIKWIQANGGEEIWKDIPGYDGKYQASTAGRIRSTGRIIVRHNNSDMKIKSRILKPAKDEKGYCRVNITNNAKYSGKLVHRLVAETFLDNPLSLPQVNHIDGDPSNNSVSNLEWCDQSLQEIHKIHTLNRTSSSLIMLPKKVKCTNTGQIYPSLGRACAETKVKMYILFNRLRTHRPDTNGNVWEYVA